MERIATSSQTFQTSARRIVWRQAKRIFMLILGRNLTVSAWSHRNNHERLFYQIGIKGKLDHDPLPKITALRTCSLIRSETLGVLIAF